MHTSPEIRDLYLYSIYIIYTYSIGKPWEFQQAVYAGMICTNTKKVARSRLSIRIIKNDQPIYNFRFFIFVGHQEKCRIGRSFSFIYKDD